MSRYEQLFEVTILRILLSLHVLYCCHITALAIYEAVAPYINLTCHTIPFGLYVLLYIFLFKLNSLNIRPSLITRICSVPDNPDTAEDNFYSLFRYPNTLN